GDRALVRADRLQVAHTEPVGEVERRRRVLVGTSPRVTRAGPPTEGLHLHDPDTVLVEHVLDPGVVPALLEEVAVADEVHADALEAGRGGCGSARFEARGPDGVVAEDERGHGVLECQARAVEPSRICSTARRALSAEAPTPGHPCGLTESPTRARPGRGSRSWGSVPGQER